MPSGWSVGGYVVPVSGMKKQQKIHPEIRESSAPGPGPKESPRKGRPTAEVQRPRVGSWMLLPPSVALLIYLYFWFGPAPALQDPWWAAAALMDSAAAEQDPVRRQEILDRSGAELKKLSALHPYHARVHFLVAVYDTRTGQFDSAIKEAREAIRLGSGSIVNRVDVIAQQALVEATNKKAQGFIDKNDYETALAVLRESYPDAPDNKVLLLSLGKVCLMKRDTDSAQQYLDAALKVDPQNAEVHMVLGDLARSLGQTPKAIEYLEKAIALDPKLTEAKTLLATLKNSSQNDD